MAPPINEVDVDYEAQIQEIRRLISSTTDADRRILLEEQLKELELASLQQENTNEPPLPSARHERRKSFRPPSAKPRAALTPLAEDKEVHLALVTSNHPLDIGGPDVMSNLILDTLATSVDERFLPVNVLSSDHGSFWMSTGIYPQLLRLVLREPVRIRVVEMQVLEVEIPTSDTANIRTHQFTLTQDEPTEVLEVGIESGDSDFSVVYSVRLEQLDANNDR